MAGFGAFGAFGATVLPVNWQLAGFIAGCTSMSVAALGTAAHFVNQHRETHNRPRLKMEPIHLIVIGLLIALSGVAWQHFWWHPTSQEITAGATSVDHVAAEQPAAQPNAGDVSQIKRLEGELAAKNTALETAKTQLRAALQAIPPKQLGPKSTLSLVYALARRDIYIHPPFPPQPDPHDHKWAVIITAPRENEPIVEALKSIILNGNFSIRFLGLPDVSEKDFAKT